MTPLKSISCGNRCTPINHQNRLCDEAWVDECMSSVGIEDFEGAFPHNPVDQGMYRLVCSCDGLGEYSWEFVNVKEEEARAQAKEDLERIKERLEVK
jgi:hypothetical protein